MLNYLRNVLANLPEGWLSITTHRLDIYNEKLAKTEFLDEFEKLYQENSNDPKLLAELPTAYDYIRLGHPLSCVLEWAIAKLNQSEAKTVISFSSQVTPILAILRTNLLKNKKTKIIYQDQLPDSFDIDIVKNIYGYNFEVESLSDFNTSSDYSDSTILITKDSVASQNKSFDFVINTYNNLGSVLLVNGTQNQDYISAIQHVRRRETIAMTPANCLIALQSIISNKPSIYFDDHVSENKSQVLDNIRQISGSDSKAVVGSSGLSIQYAIMMGLIHNAVKNHPGKEIKFVVPPNCYGGTNDQARRVAACIENVEIVDLPVDGGNDMVEGINIVLDRIASEDAIPYIIAEIPTNPRVEVPNLIKLKEALSRERSTASGEKAIDPVFILDQTFCPNVHFLGEGEILSSVRTISYASGSKFPSGGLCTAGYCIGNNKTSSLMDMIEIHLHLCDNEATALQYEILAKQMPSMLQRIQKAYDNTREFVTYIEQKLPSAKINFVSEELANQGFTPSVFSLDLPTKGDTPEEKETYKRALNHRLIKLMISEIPNESKYCVSYGQLKGCYWTIPATSTQGTTKEGDKDYIARVALSGNMDLALHKKVFSDFVASLE